MTSAIIIIICTLLLFAYIFDISAAKTKIPSVILLLLLGYAVRQAAGLFEITIPDLNSILPVLGTVGLILIVLEGSLELELNKSKLKLIQQTSLMALLPMLLFSLALAYALHYYAHVSFKTALANAIPLSIISSAIAIPSVRNFVSHQKEFVTYESSLSDIFGVIFFNFITLNDNIGMHSVKHFFVQLIVIFVVTLVATLLLAFLLSRIKHHVKFAPIILMIILIYAISKEFHLPALIFILLFGLFAGNIDLFKNNKFINKLQPDILNREIHKFRELTIEMTFLARALFFLLFGFLIETNNLFNTETLLWAVCICAGIFLIRYLFLKLFKLPFAPLGYIAPRGLITILLFFYIPIADNITIINKSLITQVIILTAFIMMFGTISNKREEPEELSDDESDEIKLIN